MEVIKMDRINDSIIELMYENRKEDFEQSTYNNDDEIKEIEKSVCKKNEEILDFVKKHFLKKFIFGAKNIIN